MGVPVPARARRPSCRDEQYGGGQRLAAPAPRPRHGAPGRRDSVSRDATDWSGALGNHGHGRHRAEGVPARAARRPAGPPPRWPAGSWPGPASTRRERHRACGAGLPGAAGRPRRGRGLHPAAQRAARGVDDQGAAGRQGRCCARSRCAARLAETEQVLAAARETGTLLWEAFVFPFHEQMAKIRGLLADGAIGELREIQANFHFLLDRPDDIRLRRGLAGGALNDVGCYPVRLAVRAARPASWSRPGPRRSSGGDGVDVDLQGSLGYSGRPAADCCPAGSCAATTGSPGCWAPPGRSTSPTRSIPGRTTRSPCSRRARNPGATRHRRGPSFTAAIRHIQAVLQGQEKPRLLAVDNSLPHRPGPARAPRGRGPGSAAGGGQPG